MIFDMHGKALYGGVERRAFRNCPGQERSAKFQAEVVMEMGSAVFLNDVN
jgi:hypothetical protein